MARRTYVVHHHPAPSTVDPLAAVSSILGDQGNNTDDEDADYGGGGGASGSGGGSASRRSNIIYGTRDEIEHPVVFRGEIPTIGMPRPPRYTRGGPFERPPAPVLRRDDMEIGPGVAFVDDPESRQHIPHPNGHPGETVPLKGNHQVLFINGYINSIKKKLSSWYSVWEHEVAGASNRTALYGNQGTNIQSVVMGALKSLQTDLEEAKKGNSSLKLSDAVRRAHRFGTNGASWGGSGGSVSSQIARRQAQLVTTGGIAQPVNGNPADVVKSAVKTVNPGYNDGDPVSREEMERAIQAEPRIRLDQAPLELLPDLDLGLQPVDFSNKKSAAQSLLQLGRFDKDAKDALDMIFGEDEKDEDAKIMHGDGAALGYLLSPEINSFRTLVPAAMHAVTVVHQWLEEELKVSGITIEGLNPITDFELMKRFTVHHARLVGTMLRYHMQSSVPLETIVRQATEAEVLAVKNSFLDKVTGGRRTHAYVGTYFHLRGLQGADPMYGSRGQRSLRDLHAIENQGRVRKSYSPHGAYASAMSSYPINFSIDPNWY